MDLDDTFKSVQKIIRCGKSGHYSSHWQEAEVEDEAFQRGARNQNDQENPGRDVFRLRVPSHGCGVLDARCLPFLASVVDFFPGSYRFEFILMLRLG